MSKHHRGAKSDPHPDLRKDGPQKESNKCHVYVEPGVQIDLVENLKNKYDSANKETSAHNSKQLFWTKIAAALLLVTAGLAGWQGWSTRKAADAAKSAADTADKTLRMQQRARLTIAFPPVTHIFDAPTFVNAILTNTGATPSRNMAGAIFVRFVGLDEHITFDIQREWDGKHDGIAIGQKALYPNVPTTLALPLLTVDPKTGNRTPKPYTRDMHASIGNGDHSILIFGKIEYSDVFSDKHWLTFCYFAKNRVRENKSVAEEDCVGYNDIDN